MSMPKIEPSRASRCQAITDMIESVALEQTALSHILNAEGEKLQKILCMPGITSPVILDTNRSVREMVETVTRLETVLQGKLALFEGCLCKECHRPPREPDNDCDC